MEEQTARADDKGSGEEEKEEEEEASFGSSSEDGRQNNPSLPVGMELDADKMRGDAIGNTLYSERWVLKMLMKLAKFTSEDWSDDLESDLCMLWDMTAEQDVMKLMIKYNFLEIASQIIKSCTIPRLTEILLGILGNVCYIEEGRIEIAQQEDKICLLLELLSSDDTLSLIQLMRILKACICDLRKSLLDIDDDMLLLIADKVKRHNSESKASDTATDICDDNKNVSCVNKQISPSDVSIHDSDMDQANNDTEKLIESDSNIIDSDVSQISNDIKNTDDIDMNQVSYNNDKVNSLNADVSQTVSDIKKTEPNSVRTCDSDLNEDKSDTEKIKPGGVNTSDIEVTQDSDDNKKISSSEFDVYDVDMKEECAASFVEIDESGSDPSNVVLWLRQLLDKTKWLPGVIFILYSSTNKNLLCSTLDFIYEVCHVPHGVSYIVHHIACPELVKGLIEAFQQLFRQSKDDYYKDVYYECPQLENVVWCFIDTLARCSAFPDGRGALCNNAELLAEVLCGHLMKYGPYSYMDETDTKFTLAACDILLTLLVDSGYFSKVILDCLLSYIAKLEGWW